MVLPSLSLSKLPESPLGCGCVDQQEDQTPVPVESLVPLRVASLELGVAHACFFPCLGSQGGSLGPGSPVPLGEEVQEPPAALVSSGRTWTLPGA